MGNCYNSVTNEKTPDENGSHPGAQLPGHLPGWLIRIPCASSLGTGPAPPPRPRHPGAWWGPASAFLLEQLSLFSESFSAIAAFPALPGSASASSDLLGMGSCVYLYVTWHACTPGPRKFPPTSRVLVSIFSRVFHHRKSRVSLYSRTRVFILVHLHTLINSLWTLVQPQLLLSLFFLTFPMRHVIFSLIYVPVLLLGVLTITILAACYTIISYISSLWTPKS